MRRVASCCGVLVRLLVIGSFALPSAVCARSAFARMDDVSARAEVSTQRVYVGDSFILQITVDGAREANPPAIQGVEGLRAVYSGGQDRSSSMTMNINGKVTERKTLQYIMQWKLTPTKAGTLTIPAIAVDVGGKPATTRPVSITAVVPGEHPDFKLEVSSAKKSAYVGEPVDVTITWYMGKALRGAEINGSDGGDVFDVVPAPDPRPAGTAQDDQRYPAIPLLGVETRGVLAQGEWGGRAVNTFTQHLIVVPRKPGKIEIGPFTAACDAVTGQRRRSFFDAPWDDRSATERVAVASNSVVLDVAALPTEGRPVDFAGVVGTYAVATATDVAEAGVGDPITLTLRITGEEPMAGVAPPELSLTPAYAEVFKLSPEGWAVRPSTRPGERVYSTVVRPQSDAISELPPVSLPYFDVVSGEYRAAASAPIPLKIRAVRTVTAADAIGAAIPVAGPLASGARGVRANFGIDGSLTNQRVDLGQPVLMLVLLGGPVLSLAAALAVRSARGMSAARTPVDRAVRLACRRAASARTHAEIRDAVASAIGARLGVAPGSVTATDARRISDDPAIAALERVLVRCDGAVFGSSVEPLEQLRSQAVDALRSAARGIA
jgi:hypothetical protein